MPCKKCGGLVEKIGDARKYCLSCRPTSVCPTFYGWQQIQWKKDAEYARRTITKLQELEMLLSRAEGLY